MKKAFHQLHLIIGLFTGTIVFIVATTGSIVSFEDELRSYINSDIMYVQKAGSKKLSIDDIYTSTILTHSNAEIKSIVVPKDAMSCVEVQLKNKEVIYVDPYTGIEKGTINKNKDFFGVILRLHRNLFLGEVGKWITGISALTFFFMLISGIILWWPQSKRSSEEKFTLKWNVHPVKRNYDLHNVLGFYASWIIMFTVLTALIFTFKWAEKSLFFVTNSKKEKRMEVVSVSKEYGKAISYQFLLTKTLALYPNADCWSVSFPEDETSSVRVTTEYKSPGFFNRRDNVFFDQYTGELLIDKSFDSNSLGMKMRMSNERIHTGSSFDLIGRFLVLFASLICASLPITGFLIWRNKRKIPA